MFQLNESSINDSVIEFKNLDVCIVLIKVESDMSCLLTQKLLCMVDG
jgi:hypothetical protein